jgi:hypothetical protein
MTSTHCRIAAAECLQMNDTRYLIMPIRSVHQVGPNVPTRVNWHCRQLTLNKGGAKRDPCQETGSRRGGSLQRVEQPAPPRRKPRRHPHCHRTGRRWHPTDLVSHLQRGCSPPAPVAPPTGTVPRRTHPTSADNSPAAGEPAGSRPGRCPPIKCQTACARGREVAAWKQAPTFSAWSPGRTADSASKVFSARPRARAGVKPDLVGCSAVRAGADHGGRDRPVDGRLSRRHVVSE